MTRPDPRATAREQRLAAQASTIRELEGRLALAEGEARDLRFEMERASTARPTEPVTIGARDDDWHEPGEPDAELEELEGEPIEGEEPLVAEEEPSGPRPVLRLYGTPQPTYAEPMAMPPSISAERLPITDAAPFIGQAPPFGIPAANGPVTPPPFVRRDTATPPFIARPVDDVRDRYRTALRAFRDRRFDAAHDLLDRIVRESGEHELARSARYWRAEALYSLGRYARARGEFEAILRAEPRGTKTPDVLLKIGLCHLRLGERSEARRFFDRLRTEFPSSSAVRLIEEGST